MAAFAWDDTDDFWGDGDFVESATFSGSPYSVIPASPTRQIYREFDDAVVTSARLFLRCRTADFVTAPAKGDLITFRSATWRVLTKPVYSSTNTTFLLALGDQFTRR